MHGLLLRHEHGAERTLSSPVAPQRTLLHSVRIAPSWKRYGIFTSVTSDRVSKAQGHEKGATCCTRDLSSGPSTMYPSRIHGVKTMKRSPIDNLRAPSSSGCETSMAVVIVCNFVHCVAMSRQLAFFMIPISPTLF
jgi:hypothetical protein